MSNIRLENGGSDPVQTLPSQEADTRLSADLGEIVSTSTLMKSDFVPSSRINQIMPRNDLTDYLTRFTEIQAVVVTDTSPPQFSSVIVKPWLSFLTDAYIESKVSNYQYIRGTLELLIVPAFPANGYGYFAVTAYPVGESNFNGVYSTPRYPTALQTDHFTTIDVAACENNILRLPFLWPYDYADISVLQTGHSIDAMWDVRIWCLSTLRTSIPGGVTTGSMRIYARLAPDYELVVPTLQGKRSKSAVSGANITGLSGAADMVGGGKFKGAVSGMADKISGVANMLSGVPLIGPYAGVASKVADTVGDVASWFGFTREDAEKVPTTVVQRPISCAAHIDGDDTGESATLSLANSISIDPGIVGASSAEDQMAFSSLFARWTLVSQFTWSPAATTSSILGSVPISPFYCNATSDATSSIVDLTVAGFCGLPFKFWRGDMEYLVIIPVSKLHRGTLQIYWVPAGSLTTTTPTVSTLNLIYDVAADEEKQILIGYARDVPYLYSVVLCSDSPIVSSGATNGRLVFQVVNPLQSQNAASTVDVLVFARAKSNMNFQVLTNEILCSTSVGVKSTPVQNPGFMYQGASGDEDGEDEISVEVVKSSGSYPAAEINFGEVIASARTMMQKFTWIKRVPSVENQFQHLPWASQVLPDILVYDSHYARLFHGVACGTRYKILPTDFSTSLLASAHLISPDFLDDIPVGNDNLMPTQSCTSGGAEFKIPYYSFKKYITMRTVDTFELYDYVSLISPGGDEVLRRTCRACAPDIRVSCFAYSPRVVISSSPAALGPWI